MGHLAALLLAPALVTSACSDDGILADGINGGRVDAGFFSVDSGPDVGPRRDAEVRDAEPTLPGRDAAVPDAEVITRCECPTVPASCPVMAAGVPAFAPSTDFALTNQLFGVLAWLGLTGCALYYIGSDAWRSWVSILHWAVGLGALVVFLLHRREARAT